MEFRKRQEEHRQSRLQAGAAKQALVEHAQFLKAEQIGRQAEGIQNRLQEGDRRLLE